MHFDMFCIFKYLKLILKKTHMGKPSRFDYPGFFDYNAGGFPPPVLKGWIAILSESMLATFQKEGNIFSRDLGERPFAFFLASKTPLTQRLRFLRGEECQTLNMTTWLRPSGRLG